MNEDEGNEMKRYLVTATVTLEIDGCETHDDAFHAYVMGIGLDPTLDGIILHSINNATSTETCWSDNTNRYETHDTEQREKLV